MPSILDIVKSLCVQHNMSILELERTLNFSTTSISKWDKTSPSLGRLQAVANYFNVSVDYLLGRTDIPSTADEIFNDKNIRTIQRLRSNLSPRDNEKMMQMMRIQFAEDFPKEIEDENLSEQKN